MDSHNRFMQLAKFDLSILFTEKTTEFSQISAINLLNNAIENYFIKVQKCPEKYNLELLRILLCHNYLLMNTGIKLQNKVLQYQEKFIFVLEGASNKADENIYSDIITLYLLLYNDPEEYSNIFLNYQRSKAKFLNEDIDSRKWYVRLFICILDAFKLSQYLNSKASDKMKNNIIDEGQLSVIAMMLNDIGNWLLNLEDDSLWKILCNALLAISQVNKNRELTPLWKKAILIHNENTKLNALCIITDFIFPFKNNYDVEYKLSIDCNLWQIIIIELNSTDTQNRKKAMYLFKKLSKFIELQHKKIIITPEINSSKIGPFICYETSTTPLIESLKNNFILIMEALEEKQEHLIIPVLSLIDSLLIGYQTHMKCGKCIHNKWLYCIFSRILSHNNNFVIRWGLHKSLNINPEIYDEDFLELVLKSLNVTFIYEKNSEFFILDDLRNFFIQIYNYDQILLKFVILILPTISWGPIPIFYVIKCFLNATEELSNFSIEDDQVNSMRSLMELSVNFGPLTLQIISQLRIFSILYCLNPNNLSQMSLLLSGMCKKWLMHKPSALTSLKKYFSNVDCNHALNYAENICHSIVEEQNSRFSIAISSLIIQLLYENKIICQNNDCLILKNLKKLLRHLDKIDVRPYVKISPITNIIDFFQNICEFKYQNHFIIKEMFLQYFDTVCNFILKLFYNDDLQYENIPVFIKFVKQNCQGFQKMSVKCMEVLNNSGHHSKNQILLAAQLWCEVCRNEFTCIRYMENNINTLINLIENGKCKNKNETLNVNKITSDYYVILLKHLDRHLNKNIINKENHDRKINWLDILSIILDKIGNEALLYSGNIIRTYAESFEDEAEGSNRFYQQIELFWNYNFKCKRDKTFWDAAENLIKSLNCRIFLDHSGHSKALQKFSSIVIEKSDLLPGLKYVLLKHTDSSSVNLDLFRDVILNGLCHGAVMRRDQRILMQAQQEACDELKHDNFISTLTSYYKINSHYNIDSAIRATAVVQLCRILQSDKNNANEFLAPILEKLLTYRNKRYFADSHLHKMKHRLLQSLVVIQPFLNDHSNQLLIDFLCDCMISDSDQRSVSLMIEWIIILICLKNPELQDKLWIFAEKVFNTRPGLVGSVIGIIWHISNQLDQQNQIEFIKKALPYLMLCCMGQQFTMRLYGQVFFVKLFELGKDSDIFRNYSTPYDITMKSLKIGNLNRNSTKIEEDFYFKIFDPIAHYSLETIYYEIPRLCDLSAEEWIYIEEWKNVELVNSTELKIFNTERSWDKADRLKLNKADCRVFLDQSGIEDLDIQKKFIPWKSILPDIDEVRDLLQRHPQDGIDIIVVATLVEKAQNLGGITRTCEVFGVKNLVIANLKQIENKEFQALCVSADRWLNITEVKTYSLINYLSEMKNMGWNLVGAEQTTNSIDLHHFKFPKKTILLLGNEKNGILPNLIPLMDNCIEIPQMGVTRSLNVHVTSAICIWEYIKQTIIIND